MFKIQKITSFSAALFVLGFFVFTVNSSLANEKVENLLKTQGIDDKMQADSSGKKTIKADQETPLLKQAKAFALRINPPPPPEPVVKPSAETPHPKAAITAKFKLIGTSYYADSEADSWALIDEVGKGVHWVKQGSKIGYLTIEKVGDGSVLINDNGKSYELTAERQTKPNLVKSYSGTLNSDKPLNLWGGVKKETGQVESVEPVPAKTPVINTDNAGIPDANVKTVAAPKPEPNIPSKPEISPEEQQRQSAQESIEWIRKLKQDPNSLGITAREANELGVLGKLLQSLEKEAQDSNAPGDSNSLKKQPTQDSNLPERSRRR